MQGKSSPAPQDLRPGLGLSSVNDRRGDSESNPAIYQVVCKKSKMYSGGRLQRTKSVNTYIPLYGIGKVCLLCQSSPEATRSSSSLERAASQSDLRCSLDSVAVNLFTFDSLGTGFKSSIYSRIIRISRLATPRLGKLTFSLTEGLRSCFRAELSLCRFVARPRRDDASISVTKRIVGLLYSFS